MNAPLLENSLREEATEHVRQLLLLHLSECKAGCRVRPRGQDFLDTAEAIFSRQS